MKRSVVEKLRSLRSRGAPKGVSRTALRAAGLLAVALTVLVACGGPSGGGEPPPTIEYLLKGAVELPQGSFDEHTRMWIAEATGPTDRGGLAVQWYESVEVPVTGLVEFEVDAREMLEGIQPLDPSDVLNYMNFGTILDYTTSDSSARWKLVRDATIYQRDVAAGTADLYSHYVSGATPAVRFVFRSYPVFSDRAVTITSNRGRPSRRDDRRSGCRPSAGLEHDLQGHRGELVHYAVPSGDRHGRVPRADGNARFC